MVVGVTGGRTFAHRECVAAVMDPILRKAESRGDTLTVRHGCARGLDTEVQRWCGGKVVVEDQWPAQWEAYGKRAGMLRNQAMVDAGADAWLSFPGGRGTAHCTQLAVNAGMWVGGVYKDQGTGAWRVRWWRGP